MFYDHVVKSSAKLLSPFLEDGTMSQHSSGQNIAVIYGSARRDRQGIKAARFMVRKLQQRNHDVALVDSQKYELPILDRMYKEYAEGEAPEAMHTVAEILDAADGFIIVSAV